MVGAYQFSPRFFCTVVNRKRDSIRQIRQQQLFRLPIERLHSPKESRCSKSDSSSAL